MIERPIPATPRVRAGSLQQPVTEQTRPWMQERAPSFKSLARDRHRREQVWAWLSLVVLIVCWDVSSRVGERISPPRARIAHAVEEQVGFRPPANLERPAMLRTDRAVARILVGGGGPG